MPSRRAQLGVLFASLFVAMVGFGVVLPSLGHMSIKFGASSFAMGVMTSAYAFAQFLAAPVWGSFSDKVGRRPILVAGIVGFAVSFLIMGFAERFEVLMLGRVLGGLLSAATIPAAQAYAADVSAPEERASVLGLMGAAMASGFVLGPALAVALVPFGPAAPFFFSAILGLVTAAAGLLFLTEPARSGPTPERLALSRSLQAAIRGPEAAWYWVTFAVMFGASSTFSTLVYLVEDHLKGTQTDSSIAFAAFGGASAVAQGLLVGRSVRRFGEAPTVGAALLLGACGFVILALAAAVNQVFGGIAFVALGMALSRPTVTSLVSRRSALGQGAAMGVQASFDSLGRMLGPLWAGWLYLAHPAAPYVSAACVYALGLIAIAWLGAREARRRVDSVAPGNGRG